MSRTVAGPARDGLASAALSAGERDRVVDAARALSIVAVAVGHWLVLDVQRAPGGGLQATDVLARLPGLQFLSWGFQVMPVFFFAGGVVGFRSWRRHRGRGGNAGSWVAIHLWRLLWPTLPVVAFWVTVTQVGRHLFAIDPALLSATRGIALVVWFLAVYAVTIASVPALDVACRHWGLAVPGGLVVLAVMVDVVADATGYVSSTTPSWVWVNYVAVWGTVTCLGRWWRPRPVRRDRVVGALLAVGAGTALLVVTSARWYPVSMVGVTGAARSNTLPPTIALLALALVQVGLLVATRPAMDRLLSRSRVYGAVALLGSRAMTIYLWHLLSVAVLTAATVLPGWWPVSMIGSGQWWWLRGAWVLAAAALTLPVVVVAGRWERPPPVALTESCWRAGLAVITAVVGWAVLAIGGFHPTGVLGGVPAIAVLALAASAALLRVRGGNLTDG